MALYTIADLHLSTHDTTDKSMEVFGARWLGYTQKLKNNWTRLVCENDTVVIPGDVSWALALEEAEEDLKFIDSLPGRKIIAKGNHDFWWSTMRKLTQFSEKIGLKTIAFLFNNAFYSDGFIIAGTRGWYYDDDANGVPENTDFKKIISREAGRLKASLTAAKELAKDYPDAETVVFMHFPPVFNGRAVDEFVDILEEFGVRRLYFGHIHGIYSIEPSFEYRGIKMSIISADYLNFTPKHVPKSL